MPRIEEALPPRMPPTLPGPVLLSQTWEDVVFLHWAVDPEAVRPMLPPHTYPDTLEGRTYVGLVALVVANSRVGGVLPTGHLRQINVRIYGVDRLGRQGVVFRSMDVSRVDAVIAGRSVAWQPLHWSEMSAQREAGQVRYRCRRRVASRLASSTLDVRIGDAITDQDPFEVFVTARWGLHTNHPLGVYWVPVVHRPWQLHRAEVQQYDARLVRAAGFPIADSTPPVSALYSPGVVGHVGRPSRVGT